MGPLSPLKQSRLSIQDTAWVGRGGQSLGWASGCYLVLGTAVRGLTENRAV